MTLGSKSLAVVLELPAVPDVRTIFLLEDKNTNAERCSGSGHLGNQFKLSTTGLSPLSFRLMKQRTGELQTLVLAAR
jgi:hypothetical protein